MCILRILKKWAHYYVTMKMRNVNLLGAQKEVQAAAAFESTLTSEIETPSKQ